MKSALLILSLAIAIQTVLGQGDVLPTKKTCDDFLGSQTCDALRNLALSLKLKASAVQDAVTEAIKQHKTNAKEMLGFIKGYIAERFPCEKVLTEDLCKILMALGQRVKLTTQQVRMAIETAVANGSSKVQDIYKKAIEILTSEVRCELIFGKVACDNINEAMDKFHENRALLKEAIISVALKNYNNAKDMLTAVKTYLVNKIVNFQCDDVLPSDVCIKISNLAAKLKILPVKVKHAIELAVMNGAKTATAIYQKTIEILTTYINCPTILSETACKNFVEIAKRLNEQTDLIKEAIMAAYLKQVTDVAEVSKMIRDKLVEMAVNFKCTDVLPQLQCTFLENLIKRFKLQSDELRKVLIEAIVNGTSTMKQIYDKSIGAIIKDAKSVKCEQLISKDTCNILEALAKNLKLNIDDVTLAVKEAIATGKNTTDAIIAFVRKIIVDQASCTDFFPGITGRLFCKGLQLTAVIAGTTYDATIGKIREWVANGHTKIHNLRVKVVEYLKSLMSRKKRSLDNSDISKLGDWLVNSFLDLTEKISVLSKQQQEKIMKKIQELIDAGQSKLAIFNNLVKEFVEKYLPKNGEVQDPLFLY